MLRRLRAPWTDRQATVRLGAVAASLLGLILLMVVFVVARAWPTLVNNDLVGWLLPGGDPDKQMSAMITTSRDPPASVYHLNAWPLVYGTLLTTAFAVVAGLVLAVLASVFIVEFAPERARRVVVPAVRLLAAIPSVVYGLVGILVLAPFVGQHLISPERKASVAFIVQLDGTGLLVASALLTLMITPIMVAIIVEALRAIPRGWREGAQALGANRWEAIWGVSVAAARPAIIAAAVLACARALGEAVMISMVSGSRAFEPKPQDGLTFLFEPMRTLAATMVENVDAINAPAIKSTVYALAALLLLSSLVLSLGGYVARLPLRNLGMRV